MLGFIVFFAALLFAFPSCANRPDSDAILPESLHGPHGTLVGHTMHGRGGHGMIPACEVRAADAWNFNVQMDGVPPANIISTKIFRNHGTVGTGDFYCGDTEFGIVCPTWELNGGPFGTGAVWFDDPGGTVLPELISDYKSNFQNCTSAGKLTVAYHVMPLRTGGSIGDFRTHAVFRDGVFFSGINRGFFLPNADRICMNIAGVIDLDEVGSDGPLYCGDVGITDGWGEGANTENNPGDGQGTNLVKDVWAHVVFTFAEEDEVNGADGADGRYRVYVDGDLINSLDNEIVGDMPNTTSKWKIAGPTGFADDTTFKIDNLQIECEEWDLDRVRLASDCDVPNRQQF